MWSRGLPWIRRAGDVPATSSSVHAAVKLCLKSIAGAVPCAGPPAADGFPPGTPLGGAGSGRIHHVLCALDADSVSAPYTQHLIVEKSEAP